MAYTYLALWLYTKFKIVMVRNWLLRLFGLSEIVARQAVEIDRLQMQCIERDLYHELFALADEELFQTVRRYKLWEPNDVY